MQSGSLTWKDTQVPVEWMQGFSIATEASVQSLPTMAAVFPTPQDTGAVSNIGAAFGPEQQWVRGQRIDLKISIDRYSVHLANSPYAVGDAFRVEVSRMVANPTQYHREVSLGRYTSFSETEVKAYLVGLQTALAAVGLYVPEDQIPQIPEESSETVGYNYRDFSSTE